MSNNCIISNTTQPICSNKEICCPNYDSTWYSETYNLITWEKINPAYFNYNLLDIYFYYKKDYQKIHIMNFTNISVGKGYYIVYVDDKWFLNNSLNLGETKTWNYTIIIVGNKINVDNELDNTFSPFKSVDFNIIQKGKINTSNITQIIPVSNSTNYVNSEQTIQKDKFDIWKIILIVISFIIIIIICFLIYKLKIYKKVKKSFKSDEKKTSETLYQKPNEIEYQIYKPNAK